TLFRSGNEVINAGHRRGFLGTVHRAPDQKSIGCHPTNHCRWNRIAPQMHAVRSAGQNHSHPIVDDHSRVRSAGQLDDGEGEVGKITRFEIAFPYDDAVDSGVDGITHLPQQTASGLLEGDRPRETTTIGHEMQDHSRAVNTKVSSEKPATRLSTPNPLTPPRTKLLVRGGNSGGQTNAK